MSDNWPANKIELKAVETLLPYARNARTHSDEQVAQLAASIKEWGWTTPVLVDESNQIIAGHGRILAARKLGITNVPVMVAHNWTEAQKKAYVLADNKLALNAGWDVELLKVELTDLTNSNFNLSMIGFSEDELSKILLTGTEGLTDPDEIPQEPENPTSVLGDIWLLGRHRIICGDSTNADDVAKCLNGIEPHLMVTDPPYGVEYNPKWRMEAGISKNALKMGDVLNDDCADWRGAWSLFPGNIAYVWCASLKSHIVAQSLLDCGFDLRSQIIWSKDRFSLSRSDYQWKHEPCWYAVKGTGNWTGDRKQTTIWEIKAREDKGHGHGTQKPVECMKRPIENNSSPGQAVYEPFSGSGTTIIAGEMTGRSVHAIELNPSYVDVAIKRWQDFTGEKAIHEASKETYEALSNNKIKKAS